MIALLLVLTKTIQYTTMKNLIWKNAAIAAGIVVAYLVIMSVLSFMLFSDRTNMSIGIYSMLLSALYWMVFIACLAWAFISMSKANGGRVTSGQAYGLGFAYILLVMMVTTIMSYIQFEFIYKSEMKEMANTMSGMTDMSFFSSMMMIALGTQLLLKVLVVLIVLYVIGRWRMFQKAGEEGWASIIPLYSTYVMIKISRNPGWWLILLLIPIVNIFIGIMILNGISAQFGKSGGYTVGLVFLGIIFLPLLGFDESSYAQEISEYGDPSFGNS